MIKLTVLYSEPTDPIAFREHYLEVHAPLVRALSGLDHFDVSFTRPGPGDSEPPYHLIAELYFPDDATLEAAMRSPEGQALAVDTPNVASTPSVSVMSDLA